MGESRNKPGKLKPLRMLIVEDSPHDAELVAYELKRGGFAVDYKRVDNAGDLEAALAAASWDIVISDFKMSGFTGMGALEIIKRRGIYIPFIIVSGTIGEEIAVSIMKAGANDYIMKDKLARLPMAVEREIQDMEIRKAKILAEKSLRESENNFRLLADNLPDVVARFDRQFRHIYMNPRIESITGLKSEDYIGKTNRELDMPSELVQKWEQSLERVFKTGKPELIEFEVPSIDSMRSFESRLVPEFGPDGSVRTVLSIARDITDEKRLEERLRHSEKMEAIGQLAGGIAHDFNNQLAGIMGFAEMLSKRLQDEGLRKYAEDILRAARRSADLTRDLLAFARKGKYQTVPVNVHKIIEEVVSLLEHSIDKRIAIKRILKARPATIMGDPSQIQNAILNLGLNARDAMPEGGEITISTENFIVDQANRSNFPDDVLNGGYVKVSVADTGVGMDRETMKHIFEPFFTTKDVGKGTGMGLASVYGTVKSHLGFQNVESEPGKGSVFTIYLPQITQDETAASDEIKEVLPLRKSLRVLVVDDESMVRDMLTQMLHVLGYKVVACKDGAEAIEVYGKSPQDYDMAILDMEMPKMGGKSTFLALKAINPEVAVIVSSGFSVEGEAQSILDAGAKGFIQKPFDMNELKTALQKAVV